MTQYTMVLTMSIATTQRTRTLCAPAHIKWRPIGLNTRSPIAKVLWCAPGLAIQRPIRPSLTMCLGPWRRPIRKWNGSVIDRRKVAKRTKGMSDILPAAMPMKMIRGLSNINANGCPNNNGVHAVPINETPDIAIIGSAVGSIRLINGRLTNICLTVVCSTVVCLINGGSNLLIKVTLT